MKARRGTLPSDMNREHAQNGGDRQNFSITIVTAGTNSARHTQ